MIEIFGALLGFLFVLFILNGMKIVLEWLDSCEAVNQAAKGIGDFLVKVLCWIIWIVGAIGLIFATFTTGFWGFVIYGFFCYMWLMLLNCRQDSNNEEEKREVVKEVYVQPIDNLTPEQKYNREIYYTKKCNKEWFITELLTSLKIQFYVSTVWNVVETSISNNNIPQMLGLNEQTGFIIKWLNRADEIVDEAVKNKTELNNTFETFRTEYRQELNLV